MQPSNTYPKKVDQTTRAPSRATVNEVSQRLTRTQRDQRKMVHGATPTSISPEVGRVVKITACTLGTGYATARFYTGDPGGTLTLSPEEEVKVFIGKQSMWRVGDYVLVVPVELNVLVWWAVAGVDNFSLYKDPLSDGSTLASVQDDPDPDEYCSDTVTVP